MQNVRNNSQSLFQARKVASLLDIPFYVLDVSKEFKKAVVDYYINEYQSGRTPNPCVECNKFIKFGWLLDKAKELGAEFIATGHYVKINQVIDNRCKVIDGKSKTYNLKPITFCLSISKDKLKDQTYFLWQLDQEQLKHILFPIGNYTKPQVRELAKKFKLPTAEKKESQGICFIPDRDNVGFLQRYAKKLLKPGNIVDLNGGILGQHKGLAYYTIGQRHGLEGVQLANCISHVANSNNDSRSEVPFTLATRSHPIPPAGTSESTGTRSGNIPRSNSNDKPYAISHTPAGLRPAYVVKLKIDKNELVVGEEKDLYQKELVAERVNFLRNTKLTKYEKIQCQAKIRYGHPAEHCLIVSLSHCPQINETMKPCSNEIVKIIFKKPQRAITPGQSVVFYMKNEVIGGGVIQ